MQWDKVIKIQLFIFITLWVMGIEKARESRMGYRRFNRILWGKGWNFYADWRRCEPCARTRWQFYCGQHRDWFGDGDDSALTWYLYLQTPHKWIRLGLIAAMLLTAVAILGTQSRGAFLAIASNCFIFVVKKPTETDSIHSDTIFDPICFDVHATGMHDRMNTIGNYEEDGSAMGRIQAWTFAIKLASARPIGGGFESSVK